MEIFFFHGPKPLLKNYLYVSFPIIPSPFFPVISVPRCQLPLQFWQTVDYKLYIINLYYKLKR